MAENEAIKVRIVSSKKLKTEPVAKPKVLQLAQFNHCGQGGNQGRGSGKKA
jgi:hypothetical protein